MKFLKKTKYLQSGGEKANIKDINKINRFEEGSELEQYLNPIYGCFMCYSGFIINNYFLYNKDIDNPPIIDKIKKLFHYTSDIRPTKEIFKYSPIDIGRYIAILYYCKYNNNFITFSMDKKKTIYINDENINEKDKETLIKYIRKVKLFKQSITYGTTDICDFYLVLCCLWWVSKNDIGIQEYYDGINDSFNIINKNKNIKNKNYQIISENLENNINITNINVKITNNTNNRNKNLSFEEILYKTTVYEFIIYTPESSSSFCKSNIKYPDCGEIIARNLVNLIFFNDNTITIDKNNKLNAIPELIEYYKNFNNFTIQSSNKLINIYGKQLNSRDAWSYLIINYANNNIRFKNTCNDSEYRFEILDGLSRDGQKSNFFQLIQNLLPGIQKWDDIIKVNNDITSIEDKTDNGIGEIIIKHPILNKIIVYCNIGHYDIKLFNNKKDFNITYLEDYKQEKINILRKKTEYITSDNYLYYLFDSDLLVSLIQSTNTNAAIKKELLILSLTDQFDSNTRERIVININDKNIIPFLEFIKNNQNININDYTYYSDNFDFIQTYIPYLTKLNFNIINKNIESIDLSALALTKIPSIGNNFLLRCKKLETINLTGLRNVISIGNYFLDGCENLKTIDLSALTNIQSIGSGFLYGCINLKTINLSGLTNITSIGSGFLSRCENLQSIDLSGLRNVTSIGYDFLAICKNLETIDLSGLTNIQSIGSTFLYGCINLKTINLSGLTNVTSIGNLFLSECKNLETIDLSALTNIQSIGNYFLKRCINLKTINLSGLTNIKSIGDNFLEMSYKAIIKCNSNTKTSIKKLIDIEDIKFNTNIFDILSNKNNINLEKIKSLLDKSNLDYFNLEIINRKFKTIKNKLESTNNKSEKNKIQRLIINVTNKLNSYKKL